MKRSHSKKLLIGGIVALVAALPAASQEAPESLLPPGFGDPDAPLPPRQEQPAAPSAPAAPTAPTGPAVPKGPVQATPSTTPSQSQSAPLLESMSSEDIAELLKGIELSKPPEVPAWARRSPDMVGPLGPEQWGMAPDAFGRAHGVFLSTLMRRLDAPLPSRWTSILLRRALLSKVPTPTGVSPADWVAERAWLLLRMGEADGARMLVQAVDVEDFTPKMFGVAVQTALATADPAGLCPLVEPGRKVSDEAVWPLADAICAALGGEPSRAAALIDEARRRGRARGIDLELAEKVVGAGENSRRAVTIEWDPVDRLNSWRFGMASATGLAIPERLMATGGPQMRAWQARAPMLPLEDRLSAADHAASLGVFSNASLVEIYSLIADTTDPAEYRESVGGRLAVAYTGQDAATRVAAMRGLWDEAETPTQRHARLILTASAAARIRPSEELAGDATRLIASMLTAGFDQQAARWADVVAGMDSASSDRAWAMLAVATPRPAVDVGRGRISAFADRDDSAGGLRSRLLVAALAGLGRISDDEASSLAGNLGIRLDRRNRWTVMIDAAAQRRQQGTVALLAAVGMQTGDWRGVPPEHFYQLLRALRISGREYEARMIAAEAMARL